MSIFVDTSWYKLSEFGIRTAFWAATVSGAFWVGKNCFWTHCANADLVRSSSLLAASISNMDGIGNKPAWVLDCRLLTDADFSAGLGFYLKDPERAFVIRCLQNDYQYSTTGETPR